MPHAIQGIHHVTAIASDPQANVNFYTAVLGLRLVKRTVNFDDPGTYHLYYGDTTGQPGTIMTFFPYPRAFQGQRGTRQITATAFAIPPESLAFWMDRLCQYAIEPETPRARFDETVITFFDPDGMPIELVAASGTEDGPFWQDGPVPGEHAIRGVYGITLAMNDARPSADFLQDVLNVPSSATEGERLRYSTKGAGPGQHIDIVELPNVKPGQVAAGSVHHAAFRVPDDAAQDAWRARIDAAGRSVTAPTNRLCFRSIYFREPGGALFEIATDTPGLTHDEEAANLGSRLMLPRWLEDRRAQLERRLPDLTLPT